MIASAPYLHHWNPELRLRHTTSLKSWITSPPYYITDILNYISAILHHWNPELDLRHATSLKSWITSAPYLHHWHPRLHPHHTYITEVLNYICTLLTSLKSALHMHHAYITDILPILKHNPGRVADVIGTLHHGYVKHLNTSREVKHFVARHGK